VPTEDDDGNAAVRSAAPSSSAPIPAKIADGDRDLIQTLAPAAGKTVQGICEAYKIGSLAELTEAQAKKLIERLQSEAKEPANA
jgi:hypothetical protein